jgi:hypothetical protein
MRNVYNIIFPLPPKWISKNNFKIWYSLEVENNVKEILIYKLWKDDNLNEKDNEKQCDFFFLKLWAHICNALHIGKAMIDTQNR